MSNEEKPKPKKYLDSLPSELNDLIDADGHFAMLTGNLTMYKQNNFQVKDEVIYFINKVEDLHNEFNEFWLKELERLGLRTEK